MQLLGPLVCVSEPSLPVRDDVPVCPSHPLGCPSGHQDLPSGIGIGPFFECSIDIVRRPAHLLSQQAQTPTQPVHVHTHCPCTRTLFPGVWSPHTYTYQGWCQWSMGMGNGQRVLGYKTSTLSVARLRHVCSRRARHITTLALRHTALQEDLIMRVVVPCRTERISPGEYVGSMIVGTPVYCGLFPDYLCHFPPGDTLSSHGT